MKRRLSLLGAITAFSLLLTAGTQEAAAWIGDFAVVGCKTCHTTGGAPWFAGGTSAPEHQLHAGTRGIPCVTCHENRSLPADKPLTSACGKCHANKIFSGPANPVLATQHAAVGVTVCTQCHGSLGTTTTAAGTTTTTAAATTTTAAGTTTTQAGTTTTTGSTTTTTVAAAGFAASCSGCHALPTVAGTGGFASPGACAASYDVAAMTRMSVNGMTVAQQQAVKAAMCGGGTTTTTTGATTTTSTASTTTTTVAAAGFATACGSCHNMPVNKGNTAPGTYPAVNACSSTFTSAKYPTMGTSMTAAQIQAAVAAVCGGGGTTTTTTQGGTTTTGSTTTTTQATGGAALFNSNCASCHAGAATGGGGRQVVGARTCGINASLTGTSVFPSGVPAMQFLKGTLSAAQIQSISDYLNEGAVTGQQRYITNCAGCHGIKARGGRVGENVRGASACDTLGALRGESTMHFLGCLPSSDVNAIGSYLRGNIGRRNDKGDKD